MDGARGLLKDGCGKMLDIMIIALKKGRTSLFLRANAPTKAPRTSPPKSMVIVSNYELIERLKATYFNLIVSGLLSC
jgi:hypothetical protein